MALLASHRTCERATGATRNVMTHRKESNPTGLVSGLSLIFSLIMVRVRVRMVFGRWRPDGVRV
ncbi:hypothetical protein EGX94_01625 [Propionibacterium acidifaciens]|nr:hypothetical protein EGX94_01625 [Propionibacterium acidifaciens]